jgi:acid phosphatase family membrane protein YuiD
MQEFGQVFQNQILLISLLACFTAQGLKAIIELCRDGKISLRYLVSSGECPAPIRPWLVPWRRG